MQDKEIFNLVGTPTTHLPIQGPVDKLAAAVELMKKRGIEKPFPIFEMRMWQPLWAGREVRTSAQAL